MSIPRLSNDFVTRVKAASNLVDIVGEHVVLRKQGSQHVGLCPFHSERTPSFSVSESKQVYHCYGCKKGGDVVSFMTELHGMSFSEAVEELAERSKIPLPESWSGSTAVNKAQNEKMTTGYRLNRFAAAFFHKELSNSKTIQNYFIDRGVSPELIRNFYLGYAPNAWESLSQHLVQSKAPLPVASDLGLIAPSQKAGVSQTGHFDLFRNRAIFPILDLRGRVVGFGGRTLDREQTPKYLNSKDSPWFHKSKIAYGLFQAQKHIRETDTLILVEGYFDVLVLHAAGFPQAVATCGTALTPEHLKLFKRFASKIIVLYDGDRAGREATERAMELGLQEGLLLHGIHLPDETDPDEYLWNAELKNFDPEKIEALKQKIDQSTGLLDQMMSQAFLDAHKGPEEKTNAIKKIQDWLKLLNDPIAKEVRIQEAVRNLEIPAHFFGSQSRPTSPHRAPPGQTPPSGMTPGTTKRQGQSVPDQRPLQNSGRFSPSEKNALYGLLFYESDFALKPILDHVRTQLPVEAGFSGLFGNPVLQDHVEKWLKDQRRSQDQWLTLIIAETDSPALKNWLTEIATDHFHKPSAHDCVLALGGLLRKFWARFSHEKKTELQAAERQKNADLQQKILQEYLDLQRKIKEFSKFYDQVERI